MKHVITIAAAVCAFLFCSSCATMTRWCDDNEKNHRMYTVTIRSATPNLPVYVTENNHERLMGYTPCTIYSDKCKIRFVTVQNGSTYQTVKLKCKDRLSTYWNFVPYYTFLWGYAVDKATKRSRIYSQKDYFIDL